MNGLLTLVLAAAIMRATAVHGFSGATLVMDQDIPTKYCKYSRAYSMIQARCANLALDQIPPNLKTEIQVSLAFYFPSPPLHRRPFSSLLFSSASSPGFSPSLLRSWTRR